MIDLPTVTPYLFSLALLAVVLVLVALLLVPALVHLRWERRQKRRRDARARADLLYLRKWSGRG